MIIHAEVEQLSPEWFAMRRGIPTTSEFKRIVTPGGKLSAQSADYLHRLLAEWILDRPMEEDTLETKWMERGRKLEAEAVASYEFETERTTETVGFITSDDGLIGCSPDRLIVGEPGLLELKCPAPQTHIGYLLSRSVEQAYFPQLMGQLYVTGREWVDIQSYHPGLPSVIIRVERNEKYIDTLAVALADFVALLKASREFLEAEYGPFQRQQKPAEPEDGIPGLGITDEDLEVFVRARFPKETI